MKKLLVIIFMICINYTGFAEVRQIKATKAEKPPVTDGRLDEECWKKAQQAEDFIKYGKNESAEQNTAAYIVYDESNLHFGFKCDEKEMDKVRKAVSRNSSTFKYGEGENIEIFLDPGRTKERFLQFIVNTNSETYTSLATNDILQLGDLPWKSAVFFGADYFSVEIAVPFSMLHIQPGIKNTWGINFCRARMIGGDNPPDKYSSWQPVISGGFRNPGQFGELIIDADFSPFALDVSTDEYTVPGEAWYISVKNRTGRDQHLKLDAVLRPLKGIARNISADLEISNNQNIQVPLGCFGMEDRGAQININFTDEGTGRLVYQGIVQSEDATPMFPPPEPGQVSYSKDVIIDCFNGNSLKDWHIRSCFWQNGKGNNIAKSKDPSRLEIAKNKRYFKEGDGAVKVYFPSGAIKGYAQPYAVVGKEFRSENMKTNDTLIFWIYNAAGGGKIDIRLHNNKAWRENIFAGKINVNSPGLQQFILKKDAMKDPENVWNNMNYLSFTCFGDFVMYISGLRITTAERIHKYSLAGSDNKAALYDETIPAIDVTPAYEN